MLKSISVPSVFAGIVLGFGVGVLSVKLHSDRAETGQAAGHPDPSSRGESSTLDPGSVSVADVSTSERSLVFAQEVLASSRTRIATLTKEVADLREQLSENTDVAQPNSNAADSRDKEIAHMIKLLLGPQEESVELQQETLDLYLDDRKLRKVVEQAIRTQSWEDFYRVLERLPLRPLEIREAIVDKLAEELGLDRSDKITLLGVLISEDSEIARESLNALGSVEALARARNSNEAQVLARVIPRCKEVRAVFDACYACWLTEDQVAGVNRHLRNDHLAFYFEAWDKFQRVEVGSWGERVVLSVNHK